MELELVYQKARQYAPGIISRYRLPLNKISPEDVAGEFITKFIEKGYANKFDVDKGSLSRYVFLGVRNTAISQIRRVKYEETSIDTEEFGPEPSEIAPADYLSVDALAETFSDIKFGYDKVAVIDGELYESCGASVVKLLARGYNKKEIAREFGVSSGTVSHVISRMKNAGLVDGLLR